MKYLLLALLTPLLLTCSLQSASEDNLCFENCQTVHGQAVYSARWQGRDNFLRVDRCACTLRGGSTVYHLFPYYE